MSAAKSINVGIVQMAIDPDPVMNRAKAAEMITDAALLGADLICLPTFFVHQIASTQLRHAETIPGPTSQFLARLSKALRVGILCGGILESFGESTRQTAIAFAADGSLLHQQSFLPAREEAPQSGGIFEYRGWNIGFLHPEGAAPQHLHQAEILVSAHPDPSAHQLSLLQYAKDLTTQLIFINRVGTEDGAVFLGGSFLCDQHGEILIQAKDQEQIIVQQLWSD